MFEVDFPTLAPHLPALRFQNEHRQGVTEASRLADDLTLVEDRLRNAVLRPTHDLVLKRIEAPLNLSSPTWIKPQFAALVKKAPDGFDLLHEIKLDGYRMHARLDAGRVQILTRRRNDWTQKYPAVARAIAGLPAQNAYLDGELCGVLPDGKTAFNLIQNATDTATSR